jgi:hypothetical protein
VTCTGIRCRGEAVQVGLARLGPSQVVGVAQPSAAVWAHAAGHPARRPAEYRITGVESEFIAAELGPHGGEQLLQQTTTIR